MFKKVWGFQRKGNFYPNTVRSKPSRSLPKKKGKLLNVNTIKENAKFGANVVINGTNVEIVTIITRIIN